MSAVPRDCHRRLLKQIAHRRAAFEAWHCVTSSRVPAREVHHPSLRLPSANCAVWCRVDFRRFQKIVHRVSCLGCCVLHHFVAQVHIIVQSAMLSDSRLYWPSAR